MGTCQPHPLNSDSYRYISPNIIENIVTGEQMEHFVVEVSADEDNYFEEVYELRSTPVPPFVQVYSFDVQEGWAKNTIHVYTERIIRLANLELSIPEAIYMLKYTITGFRLLFEEFGPFPISNKMIGVNLKGRAKVWLSENFASNDLVVEINDFVTEQDVVLTLAALIEDQLDDDHLSKYLYPYMGRLNFNMALKILDSVETTQPIKVKKVYLDSHYYNIFLTQQLSASASGQVTTTTTTTTTTTMMPQQVMQQYVPVVQQEVSPVFLQVPDVSRINNGYTSSRGNQYYGLTPSGSIPTVQPVRAVTPPPSNFIVNPSLQKSMRHYSKVPLDNHRQRRYHERPMIHQAPLGREEFVRPIPVVNKQPNLRRVMPTTEKNYVYKALERKHKEHALNIPLYESRIVVEKV